jgi:UDP-N-acetylglucosamine 1-carboxyvinyltransferase
MDATLEKLKEMGVEIDVFEDSIKVFAKDPISCVDIVTQPYPGFPTDMQAQFMALMCTSQGSGVIKETIFENRFMQALELMRLGADIKIAGDTAIIRGGKKLKGAPVMASDLRASAALVLAGLAAEGTTIVRRIYHLDRGYEHMEKKLAAIGARIRREEE